MACDNAGAASDRMKVTADPLTAASPMDALGFAAEGIEREPIVLLMLFMDVNNAAIRSELDLTT